MSAWVQLSQTRDVTSEGFVVTFNVMLASAIDSELFVYSVTDPTYSHVATVSDLDRYPRTLLLAVAQEQGFYRQRNVTRVFKDEISLELFADHVLSRVQEVCNARTGTLPFTEGTTIFVIGSAP